MIGENQSGVVLKGDANSTHPMYRPDIDGLRAIAVLSVVAYHSVPELFSGGFIGVDVFFVISGFLISSIIFTNLEHGSFSIVNFYKRRVLRIFPALVTVLVGVVVVGWFVLLSDEYAGLGKHVVGGAAFLSNIFLWGESGYFESASESKPLLHLWSLGIEEQFYIFWPVVLLFVWRIRQSFLLVTLLIVIISFAYNLLNSFNDPESAFFLPISRAWELMLGGVLAYRVTCAVRKEYLSIEYQSLIGMLLIVAGLVVVSGGWGYPGWLALLPTLGAFFLISAGPGAWLNKNILSNQILVWFGLISYPLYLWHWPIFTFLRIQEGGDIGLYATSVAVAFSIALASMTYLYIEKPLRFGGNTNAKAGFLIFLMLLIGAYGAYIYKSKGVPSREFNSQYMAYAETIRRPSNEKDCFEIKYAYKKENNWFCSLGGSATAPAYFVYGDSHALSLLPAFEVLAEKHRAGIVFAGASGCPPLLGVQSVRGKKNIEQYNCKKLNKRIFDYVKENHMRGVILVARWSYYLGSEENKNEINFITADEMMPNTIQSSRYAFEKGLHKTIQEYSDIGVRVFLVEDNPQQRVKPKDALRKAMRTISDKSINHYAIGVGEHVRHQLDATKIFDSVVPSSTSRINFESTLCATGKCQLVSDGKFLYYDDDHLSVDGALQVLPVLEKSIFDVSD